MNKKMLRKEMKALKDSIAKEEFKKWNDKIYQNLMEQISLKQYEEIYIYVSFHQEVETTAIIDTLLQQRIKVAVPKIIDRKMDFYYIKDRNQLEIGFYGILEPNTDVVADGDNILMIMPGLVFDYSGNRIGYGAGYYDRYLHLHKDKRIYKIALAYDFQVIDRFDTDKYDVKVDGLITPTDGLLHCRE